MHAEDLVFNFTNFLNLPKYAKLHPTIFSCGLETLSFALRCIAQYLIGFKKKIRVFN